MSQRLQLRLNERQWHKTCCSCVKLVLDWCSEHINDSSWLIHTAHKLQHSDHNKTQLNALHLRSFKQCA